MYINVQFVLFVLCLYSIQYFIHGGPHGRMALKLNGNPLETLYCINL